MNANVTASEVAKFDALASRWWDTEGDFQTLHQLNPLRVEFIRRHAGDLQQQQAVDLGCGGGILSEALATLGAQVTGVDMAASPLEVAKLHSLGQGLTIEYRQMTAEALAEERPASYDLVTCMELLEHVPDPASLVQAAARLCKPGGQVFFSTLNRNAKAFLLAIVGAEYVAGLLPKGTHHYAEFIRPAELAAWCRNAELEPSHFTGLHYQPLTRRFSLSDDVSVNYLLHCQKPLS